MSAAPNGPLVEKVASAIRFNFGKYHPATIIVEAEEAAQAALAACEAEELKECVRLLLLSSKGQCAHDPEVLVARQRKAEALLARLEAKA